MSENKPEPTSPSTPPPKSSSTLSTALGVLGFAATLAVGFFGGRYVTERYPEMNPLRWFREQFIDETEVTEGERYKVELRGDEPQMGPADALVTVVIFSDFQCPYCAKAAPPLKDAFDDYASDVRLIFKHYPLPGHQKAVPAAQAAFAAHKQGKFWEMHDWLFEHKSSVDGIQDQARALGLDVERFEADRKSDAANAAIDSDTLAGGRVGCTGTPYFLVNGHPYSGLRSAKQWRDIFEYERKAAQELLDRGTARAEVYAGLMKGAKEVRGDGAAVGGAPSKRPKQRDAGPDPAKRYKVLPDGRPQKGPDDALVTIVEFSDFECPFCRKVNDTLALVQKRYEGDVRVVFRQRPLNFHREARGAAKAALAAHRQGKFWEMHDKLFAEQKSLSATSYGLWAEVLGLDVAAFEKDLQDPALDAMISEDEMVANRFGAGGTPAFFINGRFLSGAQPIEAFAELIDEELAAARALVDQGVPRAEVLDRTMADAEPSFTPAAK